MCLKKNIYLIEMNIYILVIKNIIYNLYKEVYYFKYIK